MKSQKNLVRVLVSFLKYLLQQEFYALTIDDVPESPMEHTPDRFVKRYELTIAEKDQTLFYVGSTYSPENDAVYDGISRSGKRVVTFAPVLKHKAFPLAEILDVLLDLGTWGMGVPIELEFAVNLKVPENSPKQFELLDDFAKEKVSGAVLKNASLCLSGHWGARIVFIVCVHSYKYASFCRRFTLGNYCFNLHVVGTGQVDFARNICY